MGSKAAPSGRIRHRSAAIARSEDQIFPWSNTTCNESRDNAFKKGMSSAAAGPSKDRTGFHLGQHSPPPNATPRLPRRPHGHGHRAAPRHGLCPRAPCTATRAATQASKTLTPPHPRPAATPTKETSGNIPPFAPLGDPQRRDPIGRPTLASIDPSCSPERETRSVLQHCARDDLGPAAPGARRAMDRS